MSKLLIILIILISSNAYAKDRTSQVWQENTDSSQNKLIVSKHIIKSYENMGHVLEMNNYVFSPYYMKCYSKKGPSSCDDKELYMVKLQFKRTEKIIPAHENTIVSEKNL